MSADPTNRLDDEARAIASISMRYVDSIYGLDALCSLVKSDNIRPIINIETKDKAYQESRLTSASGKDSIRYAYGIYLERFVSNYESDLLFTWALGAIIEVGDELARKRGLDRSPVFELVKHIRNAAAHGRKFRIKSPSSLESYPAFLENNVGDTFYHIGPHLHGTNLSEFVTAGDIATILMGCNLRAWSIFRELQDSD